MLFPQTRNVPHGWFHEPGHHEYITMNGRGIVRVVYQTKLHNVYEAYVMAKKSDRRTLVVKQWSLFIASCEDL
jgi:hypothetical protein